MKSYSFFVFVYFVGLLKYLYCDDLQQHLNESCIINDYIRKFELLYPSDGTLVRDTYYHKMEIELLISIEEFQKRNSEFIICVQSYLLPTQGNIAVNIYEKCDLNGFDTLAIPGEKGWNYLVITLYHDNIELCKVSSTIECCANHTTQHNTENNLKVENMIIEFNQLQLIHSKVDTNFNMLYYWRSILLKSSYENQMIQKTNLKVAIGIKSSLYNLQYRNTIRNTWFKLIQQYSKSNSNITFSPFFLIGKPSLKDTMLENYLKLEQYTYKDMLLGDELLDVEDSYYTLTEKVLAFMHWIHNISLTINQPSLYFDYVIICDDDVFIDILQLTRYIHKLHQNTTANMFYGGEVLEYRMHHKYHPQRVSAHRNYLSAEQYPLDILPPFALGNFYLLSANNALFIASNYDMLRSMGTLEDVSIAIWMMSLQIFPTDIPGVCEIQRCLYNNELYINNNNNINNTTATTNSSNSSINIEHRILAIAGLKDSYDFELLFNYTKYRTIHYSADTNSDSSVDHPYALTILQSVLYELKQKQSGLHNVEEVQLMQLGFSLVHDQYEVYMKEITNTITNHDRNSYQLIDDSSIIPNHEVINIIIGANSIYTLALIQKLVSIAFSSVSTTTTVKWYILQDFVLKRFDIDEYYFSDLLPEDDHSLDFHTTTILVLSVLDCMYINNPDNATLLIEDVDSNDMKHQQIDRLKSFKADFVWTEGSEHCLRRSIEVSKSDSVIFISGEVIDLSSMQNTASATTTGLVSLFLLCSNDHNYLPNISHQHTTTTAVIIYMPVFVTAFFEMNRNNSNQLPNATTTSYLYKPRDLLLSSYERQPLLSPRRRNGGIAYLYKKCNRPIRELFYNLLVNKFTNISDIINASSSGDSTFTVDAIGSCYGVTVDKTRTRRISNSNNNSNNNNNSNFNNNNFKQQSEDTRYTMSYIDRAIEIYQNYKFVIAFENNVADGYITEKLITSYLAGAVPIYWGANDIFTYFNPKSMINCGDYQTLNDCAEYVFEVYINTTLYNEMLSAIPIQGENKAQRYNVWSKLFPWENINEIRTMNQSDVDSNALIQTYNQFKNTLKQTITKLYR